MPTSSIYHDVVIDNDEAAERLLEVLEQSEKNANPKDENEGELNCLEFDGFKLADFDHFKIGGICAIIASRNKTAGFCGARCLHRPYFA